MYLLSSRSICELHTSSENFLHCGAQTSRILLAVTVPPVNDTRGTSGCLTRASPARGPTPNTILITPGGTPEAKKSLYTNLVIPFMLII